MIKRVIWIVWFACSAWQFHAMGAAVDSLEAPQSSRRTFHQEGQTNGEWAVWVDSKLRGSPIARALRFEQMMYIRGPSNSAQQFLFTQVSGGRILHWLAPDGLLAFEPVGGIPRVVFPGSKEPLLLEAPHPTKTNRLYRPPYWGWDNCWFSGGALLYESHNGYGGADYLLGYFLLDRTNKTVSASGICVELKRPERAREKNPEHPGDTSPLVYRDRIAFVGTHVLWMNAGWPHGVHPNTPPSHWRTPQLRAFELESKRLMSGEEIPAALLAKHREAVERVSGKRNGAPVEPVRP